MRGEDNFLHDVHIAHFVVPGEWKNTKISSIFLGFCYKRAGQKVTG